MDGVDFLKHKLLKICVSLRKLRSRATFGYEQCLGFLKFVHFTVYNRNA